MKATVEITQHGNACMVIRTTSELSWAIFLQLDDGAGEDLSLEPDDLDSQVRLLNFVYQALRDVSFA